MHDQRNVENAVPIQKEIAELLLSICHNGLPVVRKIIIGHGRIIIMRMSQFQWSEISSQIADAVKKIFDPIQFEEVPAQAA